MAHALVGILLLCTAVQSGFLPTSIFTAVDVPVSTLTSLPVFSGGEILEASTWFKARAARICSACWLSGSDFMESRPFGVSADIAVPIDNACIHCKVFITVDTELRKADAHRRRLTSFSIRRTAITRQCLRACSLWGSAACVH